MFRIHLSSLIYFHFSSVQSLYERQSTSKKLANIRNSRIEQEDMKFRPYQQILIET